MKKTITLLTLLGTILISTSSFAGNPEGFENILILENYSSSADVFQTALDNLGIADYTSAYNGLEFPDGDNDFESYIDTNNDGHYDGDWDLIIFNYNNATSLNVLNVLNEYVENGGYLIFTYQFVANFTTHPLWVTLGFSPNPGPPLTEPINFVATDSSHDFFNTPNTLDATFVCPEDVFAFYGHTLEVASGAVQVAHLEGDAAKGLIITNNHGKTIFNSIQLMSFTNDANANGKLDNVELAENEISSMVFESASVSEIKDSAIGIYPNPSNGLITVTVKSSTTLQIFDVNGKIINNLFLDKSGEIYIEKSGIYLLKFVNKEGISIEKLIVF